MRVRGRCHLLGDAIDTDQILPGEYLHLDDRTAFGEHVLEGYDPSFADRFEEGDIVVAGENFGLGSSRESAALALKYAGAGAVVAESFARIFYRNSINVGLPIATVDGIVDSVEDGDELVIDFAAGTVSIPASGTVFSTEPLPPRLQDILEAGGLVEYRKR